MPDPRVRERVNPLTARLNRVAELNAQMGNPLGGGSYTPGIAGGHTSVLPPAPRPIVDDPGDHEATEEEIAAYNAQWGAPDVPIQPDVPQPPRPPQYAAPPVTAPVTTQPATVGVPVLIDLQRWVVVTSTGQAYEIPEPEKDMLARYSYDRVMFSAIAAFNAHLASMRDALGIKTEPVTKGEGDGAKPAGDAPVLPVRTRKARKRVGSKPVETPA